MSSPGLRTFCASPHLVIHKENPFYFLQKTVSNHLEGWAFENLLASYCSYPDERSEEGSKPYVPYAF